jgi:hypothetical protein
MRRPYRGRRTQKARKNIKLWKLSCFSAISQVELSSMSDNEHNPYDALNRRYPREQGLEKLAMFMTGAIMTSPVTGPLAYLYWDNITTTTMGAVNVAAKISNSLFALLPQ